MNAGRCKGCGEMVEHDEYNPEEGTCVNCFDLADAERSLDDGLIQFAKDICRTEAEAILRMIKLEQENGSK